MKKIILVLILVFCFAVNSYADNYAMYGAYVEVPDSDDWAFGTNDFTITGWANFQSYNVLGANYISQGTSNNVDRWFIETLNAPDGGRIQFTAYAGWLEVMNKNEGANLSALNTWYHLAVVRNGNSLRLYQDGIELGSPLTTTASIDNYGGTLKIGYSGQEKAFNGYMDEIGIWNYAMTQEQLEFWMHNSPIGPQSDLIAYWNFNEGSGSTVHDLSGNGHHGVIRGAAWVGSNSPVTPIPEPSSLILLSFGLLGAGIFKRKRARR